MQHHGKTIISFSSLSYRRGRGCGLHTIPCTCALCTDSRFAPSIQAPPFLEFLPTPQEYIVAVPRPVFLYLNARSKKGLVSIAWVLVAMRCTITQKLGNRTTNIKLYRKLVRLLGPCKILNLQILNLHDWVPWSCGLWPLLRWSTRLAQWSEARRSYHIPTSTTVVWLGFFASSWKHHRKHNLYGTKFRHPDHKTIVDRGRLKAFPGFRLVWKPTQ